MSHDDFEVEPIRGLPALLPAGERLLWQGVPDWKSLAVHGYHVRKVALYFAILVLWRMAVGFSADAHAPRDILISCAFIALLGGVAIGVLSLLAYLSARAAVYSVTSRRVLIRHGVAVQLTLNIPFRFIESASLKSYRDGSGDIALALPRSERVGYMITWPHLRPGRITRPQPSLRALSDARTAAEVLCAALAAEAGAAGVVTAPAAPTPAIPQGATPPKTTQPQPMGPRTAAA